MKGRASITTFSKLLRFDPMTLASSVVNIVKTIDMASVPAINAHTKLNKGRQHEPNVVNVTMAYIFFCSTTRNSCTT